MPNHYEPEKSQEYDECVIRAICSSSPSLIAIHEVIFMYLKELSFYLLELKKTGTQNEGAKHCLFDALSVVLTGINLNQQQYKEIISKLDNTLSTVKKEYIIQCEKNKKNPCFLKPIFKHLKDFSLSNGIKKGEKYIRAKLVILTSEQKHLHDIMIMMLKSLYLRAFELKNIDGEFEDVCYLLLSALNMMNFPDTPSEKLKEKIDEMAALFYELQNRLISKKDEVYGKAELTEVSFSSTTGKAIMVVGCNIKELETVLRATEGRDVDIYTHGLDMLIAHTYPWFKQYGHLKGHFGQWCDNALWDYAMFPGSILMTRHAAQKTEYIYRGRLYTTDLVPQSGVIKIENKNLEPLIQAALTAKGIRKGQKRPSLNIGFNEEEFSKRVNDVFDRLEKGELRHLYVVGLLNHERTHKEYFDRFFKLVPKDCFIISFAHEKTGKNIMHLNSVFDYSVACKFLELLSKRTKLDKIKVSLFLTSCNRHTVATILGLKKLGVKNIFMSKCPPKLANPALIDFIKETYRIEEFFDPKEDIEKTLNGTVGNGNQQN